MEKDKAEDIQGLFKGVPAKNVIIAFDDKPPKTLEQCIQEQKTKKQECSKKRSKKR